MTAENFTYYLKNPEHLYQISYQELKSLVVQYPYCQNLRYLLVTKSQIDSLEEYQKDLQIAATYSVDRPYLYYLIHQDRESLSTTDNFILNDDYLELKDISENQNESLNLTPEPIVLEQKADIIEDVPQDNLDSISDLNKENVPFMRKIKRIKRVTLNDAPQIVEAPEVVTPIIETSNSFTPTDIPIIAASSLTLRQLIEKTTQEAEEETIENEVPKVEISDAEIISDNSEMITYMEKPKKKKSVIDQLLGRDIGASNSIEDLEEEPISSEQEPITIISLEDELESSPSPAIDYTDLSPVKEKPSMGREVLFEITNKTNQEMDAIRQKTKEKEEVPLENTMKAMEQIESNIPDEEDNTPSSPIPKTSFKSYLEKFQPPAGIIEEIEEEAEISNAIDEAVEEEMVAEIAENIKKKKKKKKKEAKKKLAAKKKKEKKKAKRKKKERVIEIARRSIEANEDVVSETLAELLAQQGSRKKAIRMYKRLSLIFPKKSSFFAEKIAKLKK